MSGSHGTSSKTELRAKMEAKFQASGLTRTEFREEMMKTGEAAQTMRALQSAPENKSDSGNDKAEMDFKPTTAGLTSAEPPSVTADSGPQSGELNSQAQSGTVTSDTLVEQFGMGAEIDIKA